MDYPDGLSDGHARPPGGVHRHASLLSIAVLGGLLATAMTGVLGGGPSTATVAEAPAASLSVDMPRRLRNGMFFEMRVTIRARRDLAKPAIVLPPALWRDLTINTTVPAPSEEGMEGEAFRFDYGALKAGETLVVKIDGQINPPLVGRNAGTVALYDGGTRVAALPVELTVLP